MTTYYAHLQDFVDAYVGPFASEKELMEHVKWCKDVRGDSATLIGIVEAIPSDAFTLTPEEDKDCWVSRFET